MICPKCKKENPSDRLFCEECGTALKSEVHPPVFSNWAIIALMIALLVTIVIAIIAYKNLNIDLIELRKKYFDDEEFIKIDKVYNDANGSTQLNHSVITYLCIDYTVTKKNMIYNGNSQIYMKIIKPSGKLMTGSNSPSGFTCTVEKNYTLGWGNEDPGSYDEVGLYTIEFWYGEKYPARKSVYSIYIY